MNQGITKQGVIVVVTGDKRYSDWAQVHRALGAFHKKHYIELLITGHHRGAEEFAYIWAKQTIGSVLTVMPMPDMINRKSLQLRNSRVLEDYQPFAVIAFPGFEPQRSHLVSCARAHDINVWEVPADF